MRESTVEPAILDPPVPKQPPVARLGDELPIFCERCGYSLHGLAQVRCEHCAILQFHCPECGHHQPINTLRPAVQRLVGRLRAFAIGVWAFFCLATIGMSLFGWFAAGYEYANWWAHGPNPVVNDIFTGFPVSDDDVFGFAICGLLFGGVMRMLLLRWRNGGWVGVTLAALVVLALFAGTCYWEMDRQRNQSPYRVGYFMMLHLAGISVLVGAMLAWPIWVAVVSTFLPQSTARALLAWQRSFSEPSPKRDASSEIARA